MMQPAFRPERIASYATVMEEEARAMARTPSVGDHITAFDLSHAEAASIGMICGGSIEVLFQRRA